MGRVHFKILVEYDPRYTIQQREDVDRTQMNRLLAENPNCKVVQMARRLVEDNRAELFAVLETTLTNNNN